MLSARAHWRKTGFPICTISYFAAFKDLGRRRMRCLLSAIPSANRVKQESYPLLVIRSAFFVASLVDKPMAPGSTLTLRNVARSGRLRNSFLNHVQDYSITRARIFQFCELAAGQHWQVLRPALRGGQDDLVGKAGQAHCACLSSPQP